MGNNTQGVCSPWCLEGAYPPVEEDSDLQIRALHFYCICKGGEKMAFKKGQSGNPRGKKPGTRNKATMAAQALLEGDLEAITKICVERAKGGDMVACKLILDKLIPNRRERAIDLQLPKLGGSAEIPQALADILVAVAQGKITPGEGHTVAALLETYRKSLETEELLERIVALEKKVNEHL